MSCPLYLCLEESSLFHPCQNEAWTRIHVPAHTPHSIKKHRQAARYRNHIKNRIKKCSLYAEIHFPHKESMHLLILYDVIQSITEGTSRFHWLPWTAGSCFHLLYTQWCSGGHPYYLQHRTFRFSHKHVRPH